MRPPLAARLSRALVGCYPRRWRQRYADELLAVLDQHRPTARTVLNLAASALSTRLDPAYRPERHPMIRLRRYAPVSAAAVVLLLVLAAPLGYEAWQDDSWHPDATAGVQDMAFAPGQRILLSAAGVEQEGTDTMWDITDPARPRPLATFEGGNPTALSPDGRTVATINYGGQPVLWNVANPRRPARIAALPGGQGTMWGQAFSPDGRILAVVYTRWIYLWGVASPARPRLLRTLAAVTSPGKGTENIAFSPDGQILASATGTGQVNLWDVSRPADATRIASLTGPAGLIQAVAFSPGGLLLASVSGNGTVTVFSLADPGRPVRTAMMGGLLAIARFPDGRLLPDSPTDCPGCGNSTFAVAFTPDGRTLTVVVDRAETPPDPAARDTVFEWNVTRSGTVGGVTTIIRNVQDQQPALAPDDRTVADGSPMTAINAVHLWTLRDMLPGKAGRSA